MKNPYQGGQLPNQNFSGQILIGENFRNANVRGANFRKAILLRADFSGAQLQGAIFVDADLREVNFSQASVEANTSANSVDFTGAAIQGTNFSDALLHHANFTGTQAGLSRSWIITVAVCCFIISLFSAFPAAVVCALSIHFFYNSRREPSTLGLILSGLYAFLLTAGIRLVGYYAYKPDFINYHVWTGIALILLLALVMLIKNVDDSKADIGSIIAMLAVTLIPLVVFMYIQPDKRLSGVLGAAIGAFCGCYFAYLAIIGDIRFDWLWKLFIQFAVKSGTYFGETDLTDAVFCGAFLKGANFRDTKLTRTNFLKAEALEFASAGNNYLRYPKIRRLIAEQRLKEKDFTGLNLAGINFENADLSEAKFVATILENANLKNAIFERANLKQARLGGVSLSGARLTGACIEDWIIDEETELSGVICDYVFMTEREDHNSGSKQRYPRFPGILKPGDFEKRFGKKTTIQLLIRSDDNQKALTAAFVELQKDTHSSYQGVEMVGDDALIKLRVPEKADPAIVESKFDSLYQAKVEQIQEDNLQNSEPQNYSPLSVMEYTIKLAKILADMSSGVPIHIVGDVISSTINQGNISNDVTNTASSVNTDGGAVVSGDVNVGGSFTGRDVASSQDLQASA